MLLSSIAAFPIESELAFVNKHTPSFRNYFENWNNELYLAEKSTHQHFPYLSYGTDWLVFAHIVIAFAFIGRLKDPVKKLWVIQFGLIACILVFPLAFIAGTIRGIPLYWQIIDCSFGVFGYTLLYLCYKSILRLEKIQNKTI